MAAATPATTTAGGGAHSVFVYGSLMADEVVSAILSRVPASSPALLTDYHRFSVKDRIYPAILPVESKKVAGRVIYGISDAELIVLDAFEDYEYVRRRVQISLTDTSETMHADTYVWADAKDTDLYGEWDFEEWKKLHMKDFLTMTLGFMDGSNGLNRRPGLRPTSHSCMSLNNLNRIPRLRVEIYDHSS